MTILDNSNKKFQPLISVIVPAYNHEKYIGEAIESVLNQSYPNFELIIINDGSTDNTADVVKHFSDSRILYLEQENQDAFNTINRGMSTAKGEFIAILNDDDVYMETRLEKMLNESVEQQKECVFTDVIPINEQSLSLNQDHYWYIWHKDNRDIFFKYQDLYTAFLHGNLMVTTSNLFFSRKVFETVGDFCSLRFLHDYDYIFRILLAFPGKVSYLSDEKLLRYRIHGSNTLKEGAVTAREQDQFIIKKYLSAIIPEEYRDKLSIGCERLLQLERELQRERGELVFQDPHSAIFHKNRILRFLRRLYRYFNQPMNP